MLSGEELLQMLSGEGLSFTLLGATLAWQGDAAVGRVHLLPVAVAVAVLLLIATVPSVAPVSGAIFACCCLR